MPIAPPVTLPPIGLEQMVCSTPNLVGSGPVSGSVFGILGQSWVGLTLLALLVSLLILALLYVFANFLRNPQLLTWTKFELFQVIGTAAIFAFIGVIVFGMCNFNMSFLDSSPGSHYIDPSTGQGLNMYQIVDNYFTYLEQMGGLIFLYLMYIVKFINLLAKITWLSNPLGLGMSDSPLESLGQINSILFFVVGGFFTSLLLLSLQMKILNFLAIATLTYFFPFGIFFRAFEPTRKFGGMLIGISLSFFLFYPIMIVVNDYIMYAPINGDATQGLAGVMPQLQGVVSTANGNTYLPSSSNQGGVVDNNPNNIPTPAQPNNVNNPGPSLAEGIVNGAIFVLKPVMFFMVAAVILPAINFIVLIEITRSLTKVFGEEVDISNLTRMI